LQTVSILKEADVESKVKDICRTSELSH
jgi:hypothetical protein